MRARARRYAEVESDPPLSPAELRRADVGAALKRLWYRHGVVVVRGLRALTPEDLVAVSAHFGEVEQELEVSARPAFGRLPSAVCEALVEDSSAQCLSFVWPGITRTRAISSITHTSNVLNNVLAHRASRTNARKTLAPGSFAGLGACPRQMFEALSPPGEHARSKMSGRRAPTSEQMLA